MLTGLEEVTDLTVVGRGGFGVVYRGWQAAFDRHVAVKVLQVGHDAEKASRRFQHEIRAMGRVSGHPHVLQIHSAGTTDDGNPYLVMPWADGGSLGDRIDRGPLDWRTGVDVGTKVADALEHAHEHGLLHRDVKPDNILFSGNGVPLLADFGIAKVTGATATTTGSVTATVLFSAPEVLDGKDATAASDVYSLAATLYAAMAGRAAFEDEGTTLPALIARIASETPSVGVLTDQGVPEPVAHALVRGMAKEPAARPAGAAAFGELLRTAAAGGAVDPPSEPAGEPPTAQLTPPPAAPTPHPHPRPAPVAAGVPPGPVAAEGLPSQGGDRRSAAPLVLGLVAGLALLALVGGAIWWIGGREAPVDLAADGGEAADAAAVATASPTSPADQAPDPSPSADPTPSADPAPTTDVKPSPTPTPTVTPTGDDDADATPTAQPPPEQEDDAYDGPQVDVVDPATLPTYAVAAVALDDVLHARSGPGPDHAVVGELAHDAQGVVRTGRTADVGDRAWWEVQLADGGRGWVSSRFLVPQPDDGYEGPATYRVVGVAVDDVLYAREAADPGAEVVAEFAPDATGVRLTGGTRMVGDRAWWEVVLGEGTTGWVSSRFLREE